MMIFKIICVLVMMAITNTADAQTAISYTYDSAGNRIGRAISVSHIKGERNDGC